MASTSQQETSTEEQGYLATISTYWNGARDMFSRTVTWALDTEDETKAAEHGNNSDDEENDADEPVSVLKKDDERQMTPRRVSIRSSIRNSLRSVRSRRGSSQSQRSMQELSTEAAAVETLDAISEEEEPENERKIEEAEEDEAKDEEEASNTDEEQNDADEDAKDSAEEEETEESAADEEADDEDAAAAVAAAAAAATAAAAARESASRRNSTSSQSSSRRFSLRNSLRRFSGSSNNSASGGQRSSVSRMSWRRSRMSGAGRGPRLHSIQEDGNTEVIEAVQARLEDSNIAGIGSVEDRAARKAAALTDKYIAKAGRKVGLEIWRVENKRTKNDTPEFGVRKWPKDEYGSFYSGDSYIILNTYHPVDKDTRKKNDRKFEYDVHFWLGSESSQDEIGTAAIKTVELSAILDDRPVHHREIQGHESKLFLSYFKELIYLNGGHESGFRKVLPTEYEPRLLMIRHASRVTKAFSIPVDARCMNHGDAFVLDTGRVVYRWVGDEANVFEKNRSGLLQANICSSRHGKAVKADADDLFWKTLGGTIDDVRPSEDPFEIELHGDERLDSSSIRLWRISDASGSLSFKLEAEGKVPRRALDPDDVFLVHANIGIWIWLGSRATAYERASGMHVADEYIKQEGLPNTMTVTSINEEQAEYNTLFTALFQGK
mmetsp:Transcript_11905/g.19227  ORF Transcript_11905/g.19227 Transcript_11905/m.19227 type:complete len:664 (+) Transcript_11905:1029-3020(+)